MNFAELVSALPDLDAAPAARYGPFEVLPL